MQWNVRNQVFDLSQFVIMGILNTDPLSFSGDGQSAAMAVDYGWQLLSEGATILDVGGASTRPKATPPTPTVEWERIKDCITPFHEHALVSVDTTTPSVASEALSAGAHIINDVSGGQSLELLKLVAQTGAGYILMRNVREAKLLSTDPVTDLRLFFNQKLEQLQNIGIPPDQIILDPGIGYGHPMEVTLEILRRLNELVAALPRPLLIGASRKGFIAKACGKANPEDRLGGSLAVAGAATKAGALILRVHDVQATQQYLCMRDFLLPRA